MPGVRQVVVGVSGSPENLPALRYAAAVARREHALLVAVHAWQPPGGDLAERTHPSPYLRKIWTDDAVQHLQDALGRAWADGQNDPEIRRVVYRGETGPALVELADSAGDLIVVGTGRQGRLARLRHGRVSRYCLAHALPGGLRPAAHAGRGPAGLVVPAPRADLRAGHRGLGRRECGPAPRLRHPPFI